MVWFVFGVIMLIVFIVVKKEEKQVKKDANKYNGYLFESETKRKIDALSKEETQIKQQIENLKKTLQAKKSELESLNTWISNHDLGD